MRIFFAADDLNLGCESIANMFEFLSFCYFLMLFLSKPTGKNENASEKKIRIQIL